MSKRKRVGVVTIFDNNPNYGNKLQNLASIIIYNDLGFETETLVTMRQTNIIKLYVQNLIRIVTRGHYFPLSSRKLAFRKFDYKYLHPNNALLNGKINKDKYDYFSVGSDQVWNTNWYYGEMSDYYLLRFADSNQRIALSPSFGTASLDPMWKCVFKEELRKFYKISCREDMGAEIINELINETIPVLIDPTLMIDREVWSSLARKPRGYSAGKYVLTYFLSEIGEEAKIELEELKNEGYVTIELLNIQDHIARSAGPQEFIWLFKNADIILTDSFHACVFSFLFNKPFIVFDRNWQEESTNSRIETLLHTFHLERKYINSCLENNIWEHDYTEGYKQLEIEREKAIKYLKEALGVD